MISPKAVAVAGLSALAVLGVTGSNANANPFFDNAGSLTIWSADTPGANISSPAQQGTAANPLVTNTTPVFSGTYTGAINFILPNGTDTVGSFLQTAGGTLTGSQQGTGLGSVLSSPNFTHASLFDFVFSTSYAITFTVTHDDGFSIWNSANSAELVAGFEAPTTSVDSTFTLAAGTYNLWYSEANGLPADLIMNVPEPASIAIVSLGFIGTAIFARRRRPGAATC